MTTTAQRQSTLGISAGIGAGVVWGIYPFFYKPLADIDIIEIISHRVIWSVLFLIPFFWAATQRLELLNALRNKKNAASLTVCSVILAGWWLTYVYCLVNGRILEASLGYFLGPIFTAILGRLILREKMHFLPSLAVSISGIGILIFALGTQGSFPIYGAMLGLFYSGYTIFKRGFHTVEAKVSITAEFIIMTPFALIYLAYKFHAGNIETGFNATWLENLLLLAIGVVNIVPMWWYSYASKHVDSVTMSFIQYISPMCNFLLAVIYYGEPFTSLHMVMFAFVWVGVGLYAFHSVRSLRQKKLRLQH